MPRMSQKHGSWVRIDTIVDGLSLILNLSRISADPTAQSPISDRPLGGVYGGTVANKEFR